MFVRLKVAKIGINGSLIFLSVVSPVIIKEWAAYKGKSPQTPELVWKLLPSGMDLPQSEETVAGKVEDKNLRMRAFLACMRSDTPSHAQPSQCAHSSHGAVLPYGRCPWLLLQPLHVLQQVLVQMPFKEVYCMKLQLSTPDSPGVIPDESGCQFNLSSSNIFIYYRNISCKYNTSLS